MDLNFKNKTLKCLVENIGKYLLEVGIEKDFLNKAPKRSIYIKA